MEYLENPFTPSFGEVPAHLAGRQQIIRDLDRAFLSQRRRPELTSIFSGARGTGKTALMSSLATRAESHGWIAVKTTALSGMLEEIELGAKRAAGHLINPSNNFEVTGLGIAPLGSIEVNRVHDASTWRYRMSDIIDQLNETGTGLLVTVDEVDPTLDEMIQLAATYQHFVTDGKRVALLMAGLPNNVSTLLNHKTVSFLRRAQQYHLGRIADYDVREALIRTIQENDRLADAEGIDKAVRSISAFLSFCSLWVTAPGISRATRGKYHLATLTRESKSHAMKWTTGSSQRPIGNSLRRTSDFSSPCSTTKKSPPPLTLSSALSVRRNRSPATDAA